MAKKLSKHEKKLGVEFGDVFRALLDSASLLSADAPYLAFSPLSMVLDGFPLVSDENVRRFNTPSDVLCFGSTGFDGNHFGFVMTQPKLALDQRPVVFIEPDDDPPANVIAGNLADFLSLVSMGGADLMLRSMTDQEWKKKPTGPKAKRCIDVLRKIPGVRAIKKPSELVNSTPNIDFE